MSLKNRKWIIDHWPTVVREVKYHKEHRLMYEAPGIVLWEYHKPEVNAAT